MATKKQQKAQKTQLQMSEFYSILYRHLQCLPAEDIQEAIILASVASQPFYLFQKLSKEYISQTAMHQLLMERIGENINIISPTISLLNPQKQKNFITMHYLFKTVKRVKILFVFHETDIYKLPMITVKDTINKIICLFKKQIFNQHNQLAKSCGIILMDTKKDYSACKIKLQQLGTEKKFINNQQSINLLNAIIKRQKNGMIIYEDQAGSRQQFCKFVNQLKYMNLENKCQFNLLSRYKQYVTDKVLQQWKTYFQFLNGKVSKLVYENTFLNKSERYNTKKQYNIKDTQKILVQKLQKFCIKKIAIKQQYNSNADSQPNSLRLIKFLLAYLDTVYSDQVPKQTMKMNKTIMNMLLQAFYGSGYLMSKQIEYFIMSYFRIYQVLFNTPDNTKNLAQINFRSIIVTHAKELYNNMRQIFCLLEQILDFQCQEPLKDYPFQTVIQYITKLLNKMEFYLKKFSHQNIVFYTEKNEKKLIRYRAQIAYSQARLFSRLYNKSKISIRKSWINFLILCIQTNKIDSYKVQQGITYVASELTDLKLYQLAIQAYQLMPNYKYKKEIITIYERDMKLNPQIFKYKLKQIWKDKKQSFQKYFQFLIKTGLIDRATQLIIQAKKVLRDTQFITNIQVILDEEQIIKNQIKNINQLKDIIFDQQTIKKDKQLLSIIQAEFDKV